MGAIQDIFRRYGPQYVARFGDGIPANHMKAIEAIVDCRSGAYGFTVYECEQCGEYHYINRSCGNRHCPTCQNAKALDWLERQLQSQLPGHHFYGDVHGPGMRSRFHSRPSASGIRGLVQGFGGVREKAGRRRKAYRRRSSGTHRNFAHLGPPAPVPSACSLYRPGRSVRQKGRRMALFAPRFLSARKGPFEDIPRQVQGRYENRRPFASDRSRRRGISIGTSTSRPSAPEPTRSNTCRSTSSKSEFRTIE